MPKRDVEDAVDSSVDVDGVVRGCREEEHVVEGEMKASLVEQDRHNRMNPKILDVILEVPTAGERCDFDIFLWRSLLETLSSWLLLLLCCQ